MKRPEFVIGYLIACAMVGFFSGALGFKEINFRFFAFIFLADWGLYLLFRYFERYYSSKEGK